MFNLFFKDKRVWIVKENKIGAYFLGDHIIKIVGHFWIAAKHNDLYSEIQKIAIEKRIQIFDLSDCNITSRLISKLENIYSECNFSAFSLIIKEGQASSIKYLTSNYNFIVKVIK